MRTLARAETAHQLVVTTHSSHVAHETSFSCLRYFRRLPAGMAAKVPVSTVINLSEVFGPGSETEWFVTHICARSMPICSSPMPPS